MSSILDFMDEDERRVSKQYIPGDIDIDTVNDLIRTTKRNTMSRTRRVYFEEHHGTERLRTDGRDCGCRICRKAGALKRIARKAHRQHLKRVQSEFANST